MDIFIINPESGYDYSVLMQNIGIALLTAFISLIIYLIHGATTAQRKIILKKVIRIHILAGSFGALFFTQFFLGFNNNFLNGVTFTIFIASCISIALSLYRGYLWTTAEDNDKKDNFKNRCKAEYKEENIKDDDVWENEYDFWSTVWKDSEQGNELDSLNKFIQDIDTLLRENMFERMNKFLFLFLENIEKRKINNWGFFNTIFPKLLSWNLEIQTLQKNKKTEVIEEYVLGGTITQLLDIFLISGIKKHTAFLLFKHLVPYIKAENDDEIELISRFSYIFFENVYQSPEKHEIWERYFPSEWKITYNNLQKGGKNMSKMWNNRFFNWATTRFASELEYDYNLDEVIRGIFPDAETIVWSHILHFHFTPWSSDEKMISKLEQRQNFGAFGHIYTSINQDDKSREEGMILAEKTEQKEAFRLAQILLGYDELQVEEILRDLRLVEDVKLERKRDLYIRIFEEMLKFIKENPL